MSNFCTTFFDIITQKKEYKMLANSLLKGFCGYQANWKIFPSSLPFFFKTPINIELLRLLKFNHSKCLTFCVKGKVRFNTFTKINLKHFVLFLLFSLLTTHLLHFTSEFSIAFTGYREILFTCLFVKG